MVAIAALQLPVVHGDVAGALVRLESALAEARDVDLVLLPETALTGYVSEAGDFDLRPYAEAVDGPTATALAELAARSSTAIAGPLIERDGERTFNSHLLFDARGRRVGHWRKRHPWFPETWATPGDLGTPVVEWRGLRIAAALCFDLHFLADDASAELESADVLLFASAWVAGDGVDERIPKLRALARRFAITVVNANWGLGIPAVPGQGGSVIVGPDGAVVAGAAGEGACLLSVVL